MKRYKQQEHKEDEGTPRTIFMNQDAFSARNMNNNKSEDRIWLKIGNLDIKFKKKDNIIRFSNKFSKN